MQRRHKSLRFGTRRFRLAVGLLVGVCPFTAVLAADAETCSAVVGLGRDGAVPIASDFQLTVGGEPAEVLSAEGAGDWRVLIYFDTPLLTPEGLAVAIEALTENAGTLVELGPVSIVVADPEPRELIADAIRPHELHEALDLLVDKTTLAGELLWRRLRFLEAVRDAEVDLSRARLELERERGLLGRQRAALSSTLEARSGDGPNLLVLVQDGFDLDFKRFYLSRTPSLEGLEGDVGEAHAAMTRAVVAAGWTVLGISLGEQGSEFIDPRQPLRRLVAASGGEMSTEPRAVESALAALSDRVELTYRAPLDSSEPSPLEIRYRGDEVPGPRWVGRRAGATASSSRTASVLGSESVVCLLSPGHGPHTGPTRVTAVTGEHDVDYVAFFLDGFLVAVDSSAPFETRIDLGADVTLHTVRAAAFSPAALELGDDTLVLNREDRPFRVDIAEVSGDPRSGHVELRAEVSTPVDRVLQRVDFFWNSDLQQSRTAPPFSATLSTAIPEPTDHYRVVAYLDDGSSLETARMARETGISDRLDIHLVELYATVTDRRKTPLEDLGREDFSVFHAGRRRPLQGFSRADDVPLTLGLAVDTSESMSDWQDDMRDAAAAFFESALSEKDRAFMTDFDVLPRLSQPATARRELLVGRMAALDFGGYTSLFDAILFSIAQFEGEGGRKALVVLSDGDDYASRFRPERCIKEALRLGVPIYMVVLESSGSPLTDVQRLVNSRVAYETGGQIYFFSSRERLSDIYAAIEAELHSQYLLTYEIERPLRAADRGDIRVEVDDPRLSVRTFLGSSLRAH